MKFYAMILQITTEGTFKTDDLTVVAESHSAALEQAILQHMRTNKSILKGGSDVLCATVMGEGKVTDLERLAKN